MNIPTRTVTFVEVDAAHRTIVTLDCDHCLFPGYGEPSGEIGATLPCTHCGAEEVTQRHVQISRCPGYAVNGNLYRCHPDHEPGGYDVSLGMFCLNQVPMTLDAANQYAWMVIAQVSRVVDYESRGVTEQFTGDKAPLPRRAEDFSVPPAPAQLPILHALAEGTGRLVWVPRRRGFVPERQTDPRLGLDDVYWLERDGLVAREPGSDRKTGARVLSDYARQFLASKASRSLWGG